MRLLSLISALVFALPASARTIHITTDEVRCWTVVHKDGSSETRCSVRRRISGPKPEIPPGISPLPVPRLDVPPPLTEKDLPPGLMEIPDARPPGVPGADPFHEDHGDHNEGDHYDPAPRLKPKPRPRRKPKPIQPRRKKQTSSTKLSGVEARVVHLLNQERQVLGLTTLRVDPIAVKVARAHSRDMCKRRYFSHVSPEGSQPWHRLKRGGARFKAAAENIAVGYRTPEEVHHGWLKSPGHRANRLNGKYRRVGVGLYMCGDTPYWTELFMR
jgi:uncharacterized protein YkwD